MSRTKTISKDSKEPTLKVNLKDKPAIDLTETEYEISKSDMNEFIARSNNAYNKIVELKKEGLLYNEKLKIYNLAVERRDEEIKNLKSHLSATKAELNVMNSRKSKLKPSDNLKSVMTNSDEETYNKKALDLFNADQEGKNGLDELRKRLGVHNI